MRAEEFRYLDVCAGISASTVAWKGLGWRAAAYAEIDPAPRAVLAHHYGHVPLHGDFTTIGSDDYGPIDLLVGGTPCQDFSVAGLRAGLDGDRGNLTLEFLRLAGRTRPRWLLWENVPGVLSIDGGRAFGAVLGGMGELGYGFAYRVLNAQYFGVPQRRRRVFALGYIGDWRRAAAVLFERHSLSGHPAPRREKGKGIAGCLSPGTHPGGFNGQDAYTGQLIAHALRGEGFDASEDGTGRGTPIIASPLTASFARNMGAQAGRDSGLTNPVVQGGVRRLTPVECEKLQGFPSGYTLVPYRKGMMADGPRYKMLGNSMAVPVMRWIGERIAMVDQIVGDAS